MNHDHPPLLGLAHLMRMAFEGQSLMPVFDALMTRAANDPQDANALMDLATVLQLRELKALGLATLRLALQVQQVYELPARHPSRIRLLAIMAPGDLMANAPLPFLFEDSDIALTMLYLQPDQPTPMPLPEHDIAFIAISESSQSRALLQRLSAETASWPKPVIARPDGILRTARDNACALLRNLAGIYMPPTAQASRQALEAVGADQQALANLLPEGVFPLIVRPRDSHAGHGLDKVDDIAALSNYLAASPESDFFISSFVDYSGPDGLFRKYRVALVDGRPFAVHMALSTHWMIHYLNAGMAESASKRAEEEAFMQNFDKSFAQRHRIALNEIYTRFGLEYLLIDCAETPDGRLFVFEVDPGAVVHSMDPQTLFPYKRPAMQKIFEAFRTMLVQKIDATGSTTALRSR